MIAALMVERMPLAAADELALAMKHLAVCVAEREGCREHRLLAPRTGGTVQAVVSIPVVHHFTELTCEHAFVFGRSLLADIVSPSIHHIVVLLHSCRIHISHGYRSARIRKLLSRDIERLQCEVLRIASLV